MMYVGPAVMQALHALLRSWIGAMQRYKKGVPYWGTPYKNIIIIIFSDFSLLYEYINVW